LVHLGPLCSSRTTATTKNHQTADEDWLHWLCYDSTLYYAVFALPAMRFHPTAAEKGCRLALVLHKVLQDLFPNQNQLTTIRRNTITKSLLLPMLTITLSAAMIA
jgi:hypothetical protein